ncbi:MAG TPA: succinylglutamate desuccinylase/aspartoacylase family protein [Spirochaetales bacterium]|nr:succinylglutamate desuccinylase/aspartoacylase family protein [Spirochaetales bacterium]HRY55116.1 succinylglutamate desuccinylase/aspartoacylase family protein [Spirochaetia bacterium]HRZ63877.1 succinylglutamate desuccinylase/aspartoacylase family protein [Spirochaetia bacterium]
MSKQRIELDQVVREEGGKREGYLRIGRKPDGSWVSIPVIVIEGRAEGPTLLVDACAHGDEYEGAEAIIGLAASLDPSTLRGSFVGVPALNYDAFCACERISPIDSTNLNRIFPGNPRTFVTQRVAYAYTERLQKKADAIISFHGGGTVLHLEPLVGYQPQDDEVGRRTRELAQVFGTKVLWRMQNLPFEGVAAVEAKKLGIPSILPEIGSHCGRLYDRRKNIELCGAGIVNVMRHLGMLEGKPEPRPEQIDAELLYIHASDGGIHRLEKGIMERVKAGETLATVTDVFGRTVSTVAAPYDGIVLGFWSLPVIQPGDWSYLYGKILG